MSFSVLISVYIKTNLIQFEECLESINCQTLLPSEIIIIRDGEIDFDLNFIISKYKKLNFIIIINEYNLGLPKSLNKGLRHCNYEIIFRMDTDDICNKNRFELQYNRMMLNEKLAVLGTNVELIDEFSNLIPKIKNVPINDSKIRKIIFYKNPFNHPSVVFRKSIVQSVGGYSNLYLYEDWYLWIKLSKLNKIEFENLSERLLKYRIRTFNDRSGFKVVKAEYKFYLVLLKNGYIKSYVFIFNIIIRFIIRMMPIKWYKIFKHKFDRSI